MGCDIARPAGRDGFALSKTDEKKCKVDGCRLEAIKGSVYCKSHLRDWESGNVAGTYDKLASRRRTCLDVVIIAIPIGLFITWVFGIGMIVGRMIK